MATEMPFDVSQLVHHIHYGGLKIAVTPDAANYLRTQIAAIAQAVDGKNAHNVIGITGENLVTGDSARYELLIGPGIPIIIEGPR